MARPFNYDAINLNCGCPSDKVAGKGAFGAALMRKPDLVAELCSAMHEGTGGDVPITVKCRIGVDDDDSYEQLAAFVDEVRCCRCMYMNGNPAGCLLKIPREVQTLAEKGGIHPSRSKRVGKRIVPGSVPYRSARKHDMRHFGKKIDFFYPLSMPARTARA